MIYLINLKFKINLFIDNNFSVIKYNLVDIFSEPKTLDFICVILFGFLFNIYIIKRNTYSKK